MKQEIKKNLKHGYIFLIITLMIPFLIALSYEIYINGGINISFGTTDDSKPISYPDELPLDKENKKVTVLIRNLTDGYKTKENKVTLVGLTEKDNEAWVNGKSVNVAGDGQFEMQIDLVDGENKIEVIAKNRNGEEASQKVTIIKEVEKKEEPKVEPAPQPQNNPPVQNNPQPTPVPTPTPTPEPQPTPITGLKLSCSITNTAPTAGANVAINCTVRDQNNNGVSGAFGYVTVNWKTGASVYTLSQSDGGGNMSTSFSVPAGNSGSISGNVQASKDGLNVNSNFNLNVQ